jgi:hypothetical protein
LTLAAQLPDVAACGAENAAQDAQRGDERGSSSAEGGAAAAPPGVDDALRVHVAASRGGALDELPAPRVPSRIPSPRATAAAQPRPPPPPPPLRARSRSARLAVVWLVAMLLTPCAYGRAQNASVRCPCSAAAPARRDAATPAEARPISSRALPTGFFVGNL